MRRESRRLGGRKLGHLESAVMQRLWDWDKPVSVRGVLEDIQRERDVAYTTVMTVMDNLHSKGLVEREKHGRAYVYAATVGREEYTAQLMDDALGQTTDRSAALLHFIGQLPDQDVAELRAALESPHDERPGP